MVYVNTNNASTEREKELLHVIEDLASILFNETYDADLVNEILSKSEIEFEF